LYYDDEVKMHLKVNRFLVQKLGGTPILGNRAVAMWVAVCREILAVAFDVEYLTFFDIMSLHQLYTKIKIVTNEKYNFKKLLFIL
jgi:hypothetical protein